MKQAAAVILWCFFTTVIAKDVKLGIGFRLTPQEKIIYEGTTVLMYTSQLPTFENFIRNYTCDFDDDVCHIFTHVHTLATHTLLLLDHSLPHLDDLRDAKSRSRRGIEWFSSPFRWLDFKILINSA